ncbi:uncharacterized protein LY89DRAFT_736539 [Mollisia scopiformis]|uniref:Uncharacterized protein n=1 Tax=Mollisia scopiformis TaxID=149040 RepID=A0A194X2U9_MOLSC|nr:uncharacterized protein LY89DRAFT_736539 [Mollisia scopiformis]KUJ14506.1 hypothetical protein LY89DRAFT_736539 [Mollisia scopiformis]
MARYYAVDSPEKLTNFMEDQNRFLRFFDELWEKGIKPRKDKGNLAGPSLEAVKAAYHIGEINGIKRYTGLDVDKSDWVEEDYAATAYTACALNRLWQCFLRASTERSRKLKLAEEKASKHGNRRKGSGKNVGGSGGSRNVLGLSVGTPGHNAGGTNESPSARNASGSSAVTPGTGPDFTGTAFDDINPRPTKKRKT